MNDTRDTFNATGGPDEVTLARLQRLTEAALRENLIDVGYASIATPLGELLVAATPIGIVRVAFAAEHDEQVLDELARRLSPRILRVPRLVDEARQQLDGYFAGKRRAFDLPLDWRLTGSFRRRVLDAASHIPYGNTRSYREIAREAGNAAAVRAAGTALATNPLPIIVPCHRVLRSDGGLGGYRGGLDAKRQLLILERAA
jgi:methylated-DNA-[protein]-cysteine S-methyltransferase